VFISCVACGRRMSKAPPLYYDEETPLLRPSTSHPQDDDSIKQVLGLRRSSLLFSLYFLFYVVYLATGGLIFAVLEGPVEADLRDEVEAARKVFLKNNPCVEGIIIFKKVFI